MAGGSLAAAAVGPGPFVYTEAARYDVQAVIAGGERFPAGARLMLFSGAGPRALVPGFAASADPAVSFDGKRVLFAGKSKLGEAWQVWEVRLEGGAPRRVTTGTGDCVRPLYLPGDKLVYARKTPQGFQLEIAALGGGVPSRLTYVPGGHIPDAVLRDGRILYDAPHPAAGALTREIYAVYTDGSGAEAYRCDHGLDRHSAVELASGDVLFQEGTRMARFTSARAEQVPLVLPQGEYAGPAAEIGSDDWLVACRLMPGAPFGLCRVRPGQAGAPAVVVRANAVQPVMVRPWPAPPYHPSSLGNREGANVLCLNSYTSRTAQIPAGTIANVRVWSKTNAGAEVELGSTPVDVDGSFYLQVPSERPIRFELLDREGGVVQAQKGWFWLRKGEQRICVGCHAGPERAPENAVPRVLLRTQTPVRMGLPAQREAAAK